MWSYAHYRAVFDTAPDAIVVIDEAGDIQCANPSTQRIFGYLSEDIVGRSVSVLLAADHAPNPWADQQACQETDDHAIIACTRSIMARGSDGGVFPISASVVRWKSNGGQTFFSVTLRTVADDRAARAALRESQEWLRTVSDSALAGLVVIDREYRIRFANRAYAVLFDLPSIDCVGLRLRDILPGPDLETMRPRLALALSGRRGSYESTVDVRSEPGRRRHLSETYEPSIDSVGEAVAIVVIMDVTELKRNEIALRASRDLLQSVLDGASDAIFAKDAYGRYVAINESGARLIGLQREAVIGCSDEELRAPAIAAQVMAQDRAVIRSGLTTVSELTLRVDGQAKDFLVSKRPWAGPDGTSGGVVGIARDVTEQRTIAAERKEIAKRLMGAQEAERLRLARELHDQVGQDLTSLSLGLKDLEDRLRGPEALSCLAALRKSTDQIARNLDRTARELRPTSLEDLGLRGAVSSHIAEWQAHYGIAVDACLDELEGLPLGSEAELAVYRCVQEAMTNVLKHAQATSVSVVAQCTASHVRVIVEDNGVGFDVDALPPSTTQGRLGLLGMRERMSHVDGTLTIESAPGRGASVFISLAISREEGR